MSARQQLHLFDPARPLLERFGVEFFRTVPPQPGVYIMSGEAGRVLYIGQSKNLRHRLGSYKNARPDRAPRKIIRLVHSVRSIVWEPCESAEAARLKENQLLRTHRPKFNVLNTYPKAYGFIGLKVANGQLEFSLENEPGPGGNIYGAFKSGCVRGYGTLLRLLWTAFHQPASPHDFPAPLLGSKPPRRCLLRFDQNVLNHGPVCWIKSVRQFLSGESGQIILQLSESLPPAKTISLFQRNLQSNDLEVLAGFFERGPRRNHDLRRQHGLPGPYIPQDELDDLLVIAGTAAQPFTS